MKYSIRLTNDAKQDIESIAFYIAQNDDPHKAKNLLAKLKTEMKNLDMFSERGMQVRQDMGKTFYNFSEIGVRGRKNRYKPKKGKIKNSVCQS